MELEYKYNPGDMGYVMHNDKIQTILIQSVIIAAEENFDGQYIQPDKIENKYVVSYDNLDNLDDLDEYLECKIFKTKEDLINDLRKKYE